MNFESWVHKCFDVVLWRVQFNVVVPPKKLFRVNTRIQTEKKKKKKKKLKFLLPIELKNRRREREQNRCSQHV